MITDLPTSPAMPASAKVEVNQRAFSTELNQFVERWGDRPVRLTEILESIQGRGYHLLLLLIALPFVGPIPLPGFSIPFGLVVSVLGLRLVFDRGPWLPRRLLQREISTTALRRLIRATRRIVQGMEFLVRPRLGFVPNHQVFSRIAGGLITASGGMLMLPLPLPLSNSLPAWTVILLSMGALGRDGLFFFAGCAMFLLSVAFFAFIAFGGVEAFEVLRWTFRGLG
ncbi:MAG: exopolysaccharide biosynthesis protein [Opitutus sp.]